MSSRTDYTKKTPSGNRPEGYVDGSANRVIDTSDRGWNSSYEQPYDAYATPYVPGGVRGCMHDLVGKGPKKEGCLHEAGEAKRPRRAQAKRVQAKRVQGQQVMRVDRDV